jgi:benzoate/toluate 1,2-dioxygenase alpha subunit
MDQFSSQIRQYRPISVDQTEVTIHCIAPKGESAEARAARIRRYEDFFNATGMATPDDLEEFRSSQRGFMASNAPWNDMSRGATHWIKGPDEDAAALGINPVLSGARVEDEGLYPVQHGYWVKAMQHAVDAESKARTQ